MTDTAIRVENLGKRYQLGPRGYGASKSGSFRESMSRLFSRHATPSHSESNPTPNTQHPIPTDFWALNDINFEIKRGEAVGIIGRNGAGKSTLLKILSRITEPTRGRFEIFGRVSSLLEVGTGFHPELTGRENVYLNGTILGMKRREVKAKFDEIVAFSGVEKFIDTPVKHYSSGMQVRLAFAVAAHLEPEILIIDEVLAVGDAEFQKKCLGKMEDVTGEGRTVLFVSHNMNAVKQLCNSVILLNQGIVTWRGIADEGVKRYLELATSSGESLLQASWKRTNSSVSNSLFQIVEVHLQDEYATTREEFDMFDKIFVYIKYELKEDLQTGLINFTVHDHINTYFISFDTDAHDERLGKRDRGIYETRVQLPYGLLKEGDYHISFKTGIVNQQVMEELDSAIRFRIMLLSKQDAFLSYAKRRNGLVGVQLDWPTKKSAEYVLNQKA